MPSSSKTQRVDLRNSPAAKGMIQAAAQAQDKTVSEFLLVSGLASAAETLADRPMMPGGRHSRRRLMLRRVCGCVLSA